MQTASVRLDPDLAIGSIDRRLFGSFLEHMGRAVYGGVFEPDHPTADEAGRRGDVLALVRELGPTVVRYPGGNFVSSYRWEDGVGPAADRPRRLDLAWRAVETNAFGLGEFIGWARAAQVEPMLAVNLGTRGIEEACALLEYTNHPGGTSYSDLRRKHGSEQPYGVRLWCLGNELDGPWQVGQQTADEYGRLAAQTARAMRRVDPGIELVACGSSNTGMATYAAWEASVLEHAYDDVDYLSLHTYYDPYATDRASFLASAVDLDRFIEDMVATADHVRARLRRNKRLMLSVDEWNVWHQSQFTEPADRAVEDVPALIEDDYPASEAVVVGDLLITLLSHADRVAIGCQAQLVNVIAPIRTLDGGPAWRQSIFHPFALTARHARGVALRTLPRSPLLETERFGPVPSLTAAASYDRATGELTLFAVNRGADPLALTIDLRGFPGFTLADHQQLRERDPAAVNTPDQPELVRPEPVPPAPVTDGHAQVRLAPVSWQVLRFTGPADAGPISSPPTLTT